ncbi:unnamed protein product [Lactuca saligna]|uniref:Cytochrome P450 n=1 Tax=Lactuca saligna TaxID=75948 RepID=A0AA35ZXR1_LACSI|nr:unnamed protein product [Lactuca saligna]
MHYFALAILLVLTGIIFWQWWSTHVRRRKLPPGPIPLPIIGSLHLLGNLPHRDLHKLSQKYGPIMSIRLGSIQSVIISSPEAAKLFLGTHDAIFASRPNTEAAKYLSYGSKGMTLTEYGPYWRSVRKFCTLELLNVMKVHSFAGMRRDEIRLMVEEMKVASMERKVVDLDEAVGVLVEGMTCRMIFGQKNNDKSIFKGVLDETMEIAGAFNLADYVPILAPFDLQGLTKRFKSLKKDIDEMLETLINEHEENSLIASQRSSMKAILLEMVAGARDTVKTSIEWILAALIKHPRVMNELQKELKTVIGDKKEVEETDLTKLTYLHMVVKETFRLYPVSPLLIPHESMEDIIINGYNIPKKSRVIINYWAFGRDPKVWSENWDEFLPERFLDKDIDFRGADCQLIQFGIGRRGCPGMNLGLLTVGLVIANMVHCFEWKLPNGMSPSDLDMNENFGLTIPPIMPLLAIPIYRT